MTFPVFLISPKGESNKFVYDTSPETGKPLTTHQWYDGTQHPWEFKRVWHLEPSLTDPETVYAGVEDAALFRTTDGGASWLNIGGLGTAYMVHDLLELPGGTLIAGTQADGDVFKNTSASSPACPT